MSQSRLRAAIAGADQSFFKYELNGQMRIEAREIAGQDQAVLVISDDFLKACNLDVNTQDMGKCLLPTQTYYPLFSKPANFRYIEWEKIPLIKIDSPRAGEHCYQIVCDPEDADEDFFQRFAERAIQDRLNDYHETLMKNNKNLVPFFHACVEMQRLTYKIRYDSTDPKSIKRHDLVIRLFDTFQTTMRDVAKIYEAITTNTGCQLFSALFPKYYSAQSLIDENIFEKYLARLHTQSKDFAVAKKAKIVGMVLIATAVLLVLAALIASMAATAPVLIALAATGLVAALTSIPFLKSPQHFSTASKLMHQHYSFFAEKNKALKQKTPEQPLTLSHAFI